MQEEHERLKVLPLLRGFQQLQEEGVSFVLVLHVFYLKLRGKVGWGERESREVRKANQFETLKPAVRILIVRYPPGH